MELTVTQRRENPLLDRMEVHFTVDHPNEATPTRAEIRKAVAAAVNAKNATVVLDWARSEYGRTVTSGYAKVYDSKERAIELETVPILVRNGLVARAVKAEEPKEEPAPPPKKAEEPPKEGAPKKEKRAEKKEEKAPAEEPAKKEEKAPKEKKGKDEAPKEKDAAKKEPKEKKAAPKKEGK